LIEKLSSHIVDQLEILGVFLGAAEASNANRRELLYIKKSTTANEEESGHIQVHGSDILFTRHDCACFKIVHFRTLFGVEAATPPLNNYFQPKLAQGVTLLLTVHGNTLPQKLTGELEFAHVWMILLIPHRHCVASPSPWQILHPAHPERYGNCSQ
jgi:hypothetical protein